MPPKRSQVAPPVSNTTIRTEPPIENSHTTNGESPNDEDTHHGLLFITSTGQRPDTRDRQQLKKVRTHVMNHYLDRTQSKEGSNKTHATETEARSAVTKGKNAPSAGQKLRFRLTSEGLELRKPHRLRKAKRKAREAEDRGQPPIRPPSRGDSDLIHSMPITTLGVSRNDPFDTLPARLNASDELLLSRFRTHERFPWCPVNGQGLWPQFAYSDQLVFHATMYSFGMHFKCRTHPGVVIPPLDPEADMRIIQHKLAAISLVNDRLSDERQAVSDGCIAAVATLTNMALILDSREEAKKHMQGLEAVIKMRGGLLSLGDGVQTHLQRLISFNDLTYSELFDDELRFPPLVDIWNGAWSTLDELDEPDSLPGLGRAELEYFRIHPHPVLEVLDDIRQLCHSERKKPLYQCDDVARMTRADVCLKLERRLRVILKSTAPPSSNAIDGAFWRATALAAQIHVHHKLRGNPIRYRHFQILTTQLYDTLLTLDEDLPELDFAPALSIWILTTGILTSTDTVVRSEFLNMLRKACGRFGLGDWEAFHWTLTKFLWTGEADEERYRELWKEIQ
ncbi:hypothetical protein LTR84_006477 [Exophiala bonariae]|uniref:Uncharacterized protein n=1 Tax=Exophiala bonariae TaxID=1690606 RepID=A0AAV9N3H8_9EURO|nr:hypothetical protein LTR84_006477 [Exophiala bonariae]